MKRFLLVFLISLRCCAHAQNIEGQIVASQFGEFKVQNEGNGFAFDPANCNVSGGGKNFPAFATGTPVKIVDSNPAQIETATPVGASITGSYCTVSLPTHYAHTSFYLTSGTGGLQEAITNSKVLAGGPNTILLNAEWYELVSPGNPATVIASVTGGSGFGLVDVTTTPYSYYQWNGSQYVAVSAGAGGASFPASPGIVYNTNVSSATNASSSQIATALNTSPSTQLAPGVLPIASSGSLGVVKPDGTTTSVSGAGVITANTPSGAPNLGVFTPNGSSGVSSLRAIVANDLPVATSSAPGAVKPDNSTITVTGGVISSTGNLPAATAAGQVPTSTGAGTSYTAQTPGTLPSTSSAGLVPVSTGAGTTYTPQPAPLSFAGQADQYIQQPLNNNSFTTLRVNSFNQVFYVDGFNNYGGIGVAPIAWSSAANQPECQVVSYSGSYYIALNSVNNTTTPGTYYGVWYPVPNNAAATNADCAWYMAASYMRQNHQSSMVIFGSGHYATNQSFVNPVDGSSFDDEFSVSAKGCGSGCTYVTYSGPTAIPVFNRPTGGANFTSMQIADMTIDGGAAASAAIELGSLGQSYFTNLAVGHIAPGSDHVIEFGHFGGDAFQVFPANINIGVYPDTGTQNCGNFTANVVSGAITSYTINNGGNCYASYSGSTELTVVSLRGYQGGTSAQPCPVMPTGMTATISGNAVTAITPGGGSNNGSGCSGTIDVQVYQTPNVNYGVIFNNSDSSAKDIVSYVGSIAAFTTGGGDATFIHLHPSVVPNGIITIGGTHFVGTEIDDVGGYGFQIQYPFLGEGTSIEGTNAYVGGNRFLNGSATYYFAAATAVADPVNIGSSGALCTATPASAVAPPDWQEFVTQSGTINSPADYLSKAPVGLSVLGNDTSCGQTMGDYSPGLTTGTSNQASGNVMALGTATSGTNYNSGMSKWNASYWNGSAPAADSWTLNNVLGTGTNPTSTLTFAHSGSSGAAALALPPVTTAVTQSAGDNSTKVATTAYVANAAATNLSGTGVDSAPYQSASATTGYITAPTTNGHTFVYAWQPAGSAVAPSALDFSTYLASPPAIGGTTPNAANFTTVTTSGAQTAPGFNLQSGAAGPYSTFFDDFYTGANMASDPIGSPTADSCSPSDTYTDNNHPGNMLLTAGTGGTGTGIVCGLVSENPAITSANTSQGWTWETAVYVPVLPGTTTGAYQAGMAHTPNANPWTTGIGFYLSSANGVVNDWYCRYNSTSTDSGVAATVAWTRLTMVNDGTNVHWYIGGTQVCGTGVAIASIPSSTQYPAVWSATALSGTSVTMAYDYINWQRAVSR